MEPDTKRSSPLTTLGCALPIVGIIISALVAFGTPVPESDWLGMSIWFRLFVGLTICSVVAVLFSVSSLLRKEPRSATTLLIGLPAIAFLIFVGGSLLTAYAQKKESERQTQLIEQLLHDANLRKEFANSEYLSRQKAQALLSEMVCDQLSEDQVRDIWNKMKDSETGMYFTSLIRPKNTPPDVLREYYHRVLDQARRREGKDSPRDLIYHDNLLRHPNLPLDLIEEIEGFEIERLDKLLALNTNRKAEQDGADQPATAPESKSEGSEKPKPESEVRPQ